MRRIRILSIVIFLITAAAFCLYKRDQISGRDQSGPEITMDSEEIEVPCSASQQDILKGVQAEDKQDGDVTSSLMIETMSNFIEKGRRNITLAAFDSASNVTKATRTVIYTDYHSPRFALKSPLRFPVNTQDILSDMSVTDMLDGDLTGNIKISSEYTIMTDEPDVYPMVFSVSNSAGDVSKLQANVEIYNPSDENRNPQFTLSEYLVYTEPGQKLDPWEYVESITVNGIQYERSGSVLRDPKPRDNQKLVSISKGDVKIEDDVDYNTPGSYEIVYRYTDPDDAEEKEGHIRLIVVVSE